MTKKLLLTFLAFTIVAATLAQSVTTIAGQTGISGAANGSGSAATFNGPHGIACDRFGNTYIADRNNNKIRKVTSTGVVTTLAGSGVMGSTDGTGTAASFFEPWGITCDATGNVYVADTKNYKIRKVTPAGVVTTIAGVGTSGVTNGPAASAAFAFPTGVAIGNDGTIYIAEFMTHTIRKISGGLVTNLAGASFLSGDVNGSGAIARFDHPHTIVMGKDGNLIVSDVFNNKIKKITPTGAVTTFAGSGVAGFTNGPLATAQFDFPLGIAVDSTGSIYVSDVNNYLIRKISSGTVSTFAGTQGSSGFSDGPALQAMFNSPSCIAFHFIDASIYIGDEGNELIRKTTLTSTAIQPLSLITNNNANTFCQNDSVIVTASPLGLLSYTFKDGTTTLATNATGILKITTLALGVHNITCTATAIGGITYATINPVTITINAAASAATITPPGPVNLCYGTSTSLTANTGSSYLWSNGQTTKTIQASVSGTYRVTVYHNGSCTQYSLPVQVNALPQVTANISPANPAPVCSGDSVLLTANTATTYLWSNGKTTRTIYVKTSGTYSVTVTNAIGCTGASTAVSVTINPAPTATVTPGGPVILLQGQSQTLTSNTATTYQWSTGATTQSISTTTAGTYWVRIKNANGCWSLRDTVVVQLLNSSNVLTAQSATTFCPGDSVRLLSAFATGNQWFKNNIVIPGATAQAYVAKDGGYYKIKVTQPNGVIINSDSILVTIKTLPSVLTSNTDSVCIGEQAQISVSVSSGASATWFTQPSGGSSIGTGLNYLTTPLTSSVNYYVQLSANSCTNTQRAVVNAFVFDPINPDFTPSAPATVSTGFEVTFNNTTNGATSFEWDFGDPSSADNTSSLTSPAHIYAQLSEYMIMLIATNANGCSDTTYKTLKVEQQTDLFLPNAFTPNNDGINDIFRLRGTQIESSRMLIFSQWGNIVFQTDDAKKGWNGSVNGKFLENATYSYLVKVKLDGEPEQVLKGNISLIR